MDAEHEESLVRRFTLTTFLESVRLFEEGMATPDAIDLAMRAGAGLSQGPFMWADSKGLDVVLDELYALSSTEGSRFSPPASLIQRVERGQLGVGSGRGYLIHQKKGI